MADYNIYIKDMRGSGGGDPVNPNKGQDGRDGRDGVDGRDGGGTIVPPRAKVNQKPFMSALGIATAIIAAGVVIAKTTDKVISTIEPFMAQATGDYSDLVSYNNVKKCIGALTDPYGTFMARINASEQFRLSELRKGQERQLLGDSVINSFGEYKV